MENKTIYRPSQPNKPELLRLKTYTYADFYPVDFFFLAVFGFVYLLYMGGEFDSLDFYYGTIGLYLLIRLWPFVVTNSQIKNENKKMIDSYNKEVIKHKKELKDFYVLKTRMDLERENRRKFEQQRRVEDNRGNSWELKHQIRAEAERQERIELNRQKSLEAQRQEKIKLNGQKSLDADQQKRLELNRQKNLELQKKIELYRQKRIDLELKKKQDELTLAEKIELSNQKRKENLKTNSNGDFKGTSSINKITNNLESEINNTIRLYSGTCAVLALQPFPFADIFILTPTQILMGEKIASLRGYEIKENSIKNILTEISGTIGMGIIAQQLVIGAYKTVLPFFGGLTTIPVVYGLTYGIGKTIDYYIVAKINGKQINKSEIEKIFKSSREIGQLEGKSKEKEIQAKAKNDNKI